MAELKQFWKIAKVL